MKLTVLIASFVSAFSFCPSTNNVARVAPDNLGPMDRCKKSANSRVSSFRGERIAAAVNNHRVHPPSFLVGNLSAGIRTFFSRSGTALHRSCAAFHHEDLLVIFCLAFLPEIFFRFISNQILDKTIRRKNQIEFESSNLYRLSQTLCQIGQLGLLVYVGELFLVFLSALGVPRLHDKPKMFAWLVYGVWGAKALSDFKSRVLDRTFRRSSDKLAARKTLYNRFLDAAIYLVMTILFLDANSIDVGVALASLLTLGGVSSVVVGLALKEPVTEIIQGTSVLLSDKFGTGDVIRLSDGTLGRVQDLKWTDVTIIEDDNSFVRIPHSQIAKNRIINLSRMPFSRVTQEVRLPYRGAAKIIDVIQQIKDEIKESCPKLIYDGSKPFLVHWTDFEKDSIVISVVTHFRISRLSDEYWDNRQNVLMAISRAVEQYN